jgi:hypothetical protein
MTKKRFIFFLFAMLLGSAKAGESTNRLRFLSAGFTIAPLESPAAESTRQVLMMFLPVTDGFAANVNVQIQPYAGTIEDYTALTVQEFKDAGPKVLQQKAPGKGVAIFEYMGEFQGRPLHWYARAEKSAGRVYLVTATATPVQWNKEAVRLKSCVDSFCCEAGEQGAPPNVALPRR